jgi:hypothetical protein
MIGRESPVLYVIEYAIPLYRYTGGNPYVVDPVFHRRLETEGVEGTHGAIRRFKGHQVRIVQLA